MADTTESPAETHEIRFEAYGVPIAVTANSREVLTLVDDILPPGATPREPTEGEHHFALTSKDNVTYRVWAPDGAVPGSSDVAVALDILDAKIRQCVAFHAPGLVFVHAGAVGYNGRAIVIPGRSFSGKSSLVAELVGAGAEYYSDEYTVLDERGLVHPYAKRLSIRQRTWNDPHVGDQHVSVFGGVAGEKPIEIGLIISTRYRPDAQWEPQEASSGQGVMALLENTVVAQERPDESFAALKRAVHGAVVLQGDRGDAKLMVDRVLRYLES
jgi:hypothetical protein